MVKGVRLVLVLVVISLFSGAVLAKTYELTYPRMQQVAQEEQKKAIFEVLPGIKDYREFKNDAGIEMYEGLDGSKNVVGVAYVAVGSGFQGSIRMMVGLDIQDKKMIKYKVLEHYETPGLGARITEDSFSKQFEGKSLDDEFVVKKDVDSITGATISSNAVSHILKESTDKAVKAYGGDK